MRIRLKKLLKNRRFIIGSVITLIIIGGIFYFLTRQDKAYSQLTGNEVSAELAERPVLGVMIENTEVARPQTGLDSAGIVIEATTEGGITRYLALYQENMPKEIGPVRSVRPHFVDWLTGFDASVAHVGGSAEALQLIGQRKAKTLSQFKYPKPYYRVDFRTAPHNMYATMKKLRDLQKQLDIGKSQFLEIPRSKDEPAEGPNATKIDIDFSSPTYAVQFRYDKATNSYERYLAGKPHIDADSKKVITVKQVIVIKMAGSENKATGKGEAWVFKNGGVQKARWEQSGYSRRVKIVSSDNMEIPLNRGDSWFAAIPNDKKVSY